jgi:hypothetical protein
MCQSEGVGTNHLREGEPTMKLTKYGVDTAKNVFQLHWVDPETGEVFNKQIKRTKFLEHFVNRAPRGRGRAEAAGAD